MAKNLIGNIKGPSAYDIAVTKGFVGSEAAWLASLVGDVTPAAIAAKAGAETAAADAVSAKQGAEQALETIDEKVAGVPTPAELSATIDAAVGPKLDKEEADTLYAPVGAVGGKQSTPVLTASELLATLRDFKTGHRVIAVCSDSTANDANDWVRVWNKTYGAGLPTSHRREYNAWNFSTEAYTQTVDAAGTGAGSGGTVMRDTFSRTVTDLVGSTSDNGKVWTGTPGQWSANGSVATVAGGAGLSFNTGSRDTKVTAEMVWISPASSGIVQRRLYVGASAASLGTNGVWAQVAVSATGAVSATLWKTISGTNTQLGATNYLTGITSQSSVPQDVTLALEVAIQNVTLTITTATGPVVMSGTITETDYAGLGTFAGIHSGGIATSAVQVKEITLAMPFTPGTTNGLTVYNGSVGGATLAYQSARLEAMYPDALNIDALIISTGHNYTTIAPASFIETLDAFITAYKVLHPESLIVISSQNPQFAPSGTVAAHAARQAAARVYAKQKGYDYLPAFEAFAARPDGGASYVDAGDGIHPTAPPTSDLTVASGARLWADTWQSAINARSFV